MRLRALRRCSSPQTALAADRVKTANGIVESTAPPKDGVRSFKGIPFAQPPVGDLRWREPQPVKNWTGVRNADQFGPACMQRLSPSADYWFRGDGMSEDCLYLNVWTPAKSGREKLPVLVYIFGGGFQNGDGSEPRYDGESMARKGIVAVSVNYRTNIFGFFVASGADQGVAAPRLRQLRPARPGGRAAVGAEEHRGVRRRSEAGDHRRRIGRVDFGQRADGLAALQGPDGRRDRRERRGDREPAAAPARRRRSRTASKFAAAAGADSLARALAP